MKRVKKIVVLERGIRSALTLLSTNEVAKVMYNNSKNGESVYTVEYSESKPLLDVVYRVGPFNILEVGEIITE